MGVTVDDIVTFGFVSDDDVGYYPIGSVEYGLVMSDECRRWMTNPESRKTMADALELHAWMIRTNHPVYQFESDCYKAAANTGHKVGEGE